MRDEHAAGVTFSLGVVVRLEKMLNINNSQSPSFR